MAQYQTWSKATLCPSQAWLNNHPSRSFSGSSEISKFLGAQSEYSTELKLITPGKPIPVFRRTNQKGEIIDPTYKVTIPDDQLVQMYTTMITLNTLDNVFYDAQRQGRISFYMTNYGEEACHIGTAAAIDPEDIIFGQYREAGVLLWRGFSLQMMAHQCFSTAFDLGKGRQMPVHYGSKKINFQTISSPLGTQLPQAAGSAYALKREGKGKVAVCYFGEGAASEGDFHPALNFAATLKCPVIFVCRNNGYAISTPVKDQYAGDGIAARAAGYGMNCIRVDGNDLFAVNDAMKFARKYTVEHNKPVLLEAMTYRAGHHSTSDDSTRYRSVEEIQQWQTEDNPIIRLRNYVQARGLWDDVKEAEVRQSARKEVLQYLSEGMLVMVLPQELQVMV
jgi:2-oxoisovalerate dehydrogenase E1 component alpha subunit